MILSRSADYGLRALIFLAGQERDGPIRLDEIAQAQAVPATLLSKILQTLVKAGILRSQKGYRGGFSLVADPDEVTLENVIQLIDGPFTVFECLSDESFCALCSGCKLRTKFQELQDAMRGMLRQTTLADVMDREPAEAPRGRSLPGAGGPCGGP